MAPALQLFGTDLIDITSRTRSKWSDEDQAIFRNFVVKHCNSTTPSPTTDITQLVQDLKLDRFGIMLNINNEELGPILEVKVRRKLQRVWEEVTETSAVKDSIAALGKTRLQTARSKAIQDGESPPTKLPARKDMYTPDLWKAKPRVKGRSKTRQLSPKTVSASELRVEIARLVEALASARRQLAEIEEEEEEEEEKPAHQVTPGRSKSESSSSVQEQHT